jgi:dimethylhistidine N-methyltransferase
MATAWHLPTETAADCAVADEVLRGLSHMPKSLAPWLFYDAVGSALFEQITELPEYYLTRAERSIFTAHAREIIAMANGDSQLPLHVLELGAGSASKTGLLLAAAVAQQGSVLYQPMDVSATALQLAATHLESAVQGVVVDPHVADYTRGFCGLHRPAGPRLALYIGSSIGNFEPQAAVRVLRLLREQLAHEDKLLLGTDLRKDEATMLAAYNDAQGVTAAFNKNVLARLNRELAADFNVAFFAHQARWNDAESRMEMHLVSGRDQRVAIAALDLKISFRAGETIHTESSYKYSPAMVQHLLAESGFEVTHQWRDSDGLFLETLAAPA